MWRRSLVLIVISAVASFSFLVREANAYSNEWRWTILAHSGSWPTKTQAIAYLHSRASSDPRYGLLTNETTQFINDDNERVLLTGDPVAPTTGDRGYWNGEVAAAPDFGRTVVAGQ